MAADVAQWKRSNIKCYASAFSKILVADPRVARDKFVFDSVIILYY